MKTTTYIYENGRLIPVDVTPVTPVTPRPYRRHAAITPLELRGAHRMLSSARTHVIETSSIGSQEGFMAYQILTDALLNVTRELEAL